jgi:lipopolysaccharide/colanic/teichoic acid biosynthesis glycosyltransferase
LQFFLVVFMIETTDNPESRVLWRPEVRPTAPDANVLLPWASWYLTGKAAIEYACAVVLTILFAPLVLLTAALVKLTSPGPVFYAQTRLGRRGKPFRIYKIRTMVHNCELHSGPQWSTGRDSRITAVGRFLRKTHLDELPQLWNVLRGDMSLVGPRPERPEFVPSLERAIPCYGDRMLVRPGVTGLAQVQLPADTDLSSVRRKLAYDLYYVRHLSFWLDLRIVLCTVGKVAGVPFHLLGQFFGIPSRHAVEQAFEAHQARITLAALNPSA